MKIQLKDYDLSAARARMRALVERERGLVHAPNGTGLESTYQIRTLENSGSAMRRLVMWSAKALIHLPYAEGGAARPSGPKGEWLASMEDLRLELPLVRALLIIRGHPCYPAFDPIDFRHVNQPGMGALLDDGTWDEEIEFVPGGEYDAAPILERLFEQHPFVWSYDSFIEAVAEGAFAAFGDQEIDSTWLPRQIYPGSRIGMYATVWSFAMLYDAAGALEPSYSRADALSGEWWLIQPVSPRLVHSELANRFGLQLAGYLPDAALDVPGRVVMACYPKQDLDDAERSARIADSKWVVGFQKVMWAKDRRPLTIEGFALVPRLDGVTEESYGPYKHSSELPAWPAEGHV